MNKKTITLLLPTLNEVVGFKAIFPKIDTNLFDKILVIDGVVNRWYCRIRKKP